MPAYISLVTIAIVTILIIQTAILLSTSKLYKVSGSKDKNPLLIPLLSFIAQLVVMIIFALILPAIVAIVLGIIINITVFCIILRRKYEINLKQTLGIYVVNTIFFPFAGIIFALFVSLPIKNFFLETFVVDGSSMNPHYISGDYMIIEKYDRNFQRDDVIVYRESEDASSTYSIKRIKGLPNEKILLSNGVLFINNAPTIDTGLVGPSATNTTNITLGNDEYFAIIDNLENSASDPMVDGTIKASQIVGKIVINLGQIWNQ